MAKGKFIQTGKTIDYINGGGADVEYGDVVAISARIGIAAENIAVGATGALNVSGVYELPADNTAAFSIGDEVYWDGAKLTKTAGGVVAGWITEPKAQAGAVARVKID